MGPVIQMFFKLSCQVAKNGNRFAPALMKNARMSTKQTIEEPPQEEFLPEDEKVYVEDVKTKILIASMEFVKDEGWSKGALAKGAKAIGYAPTVHTIFPHGAAHLVHYFTTRCNKDLAQKMEMEVSEKPNISASDKPVKFIEDSIITRIEMIEPYKATWSTALATVINSKLALEQAATLLKLSDDICYFAGDRSVDSTWYARRAVVAGIYQASELHWLGGGKDTRAFTSQQLQTATNLEDIPKNISALLTVVRNILPINLNR